MAEQGSDSADRGGRSVVKSGLLSMLALAALGLTRLVHGSLISHHTSKPVYGLVTVLIGITVTTGLFLPGGLSSAASKFISFQLGAGRPGAAAGVYRLITRFGYLISALLGLAVGVGTHLWLNVSAAEAVSTALLTVAFSAYSIDKASLYGFGRVQTYVRLELAGSLTAIGLTLLVVLAGWTSYLLPLTVGYTVLVLGAWWSLRRDAAAAGDPARQVSAADKREMAGYVGLASLGGMAAAGLLQILPLLALVITDRVQVAYFGASVALVAPFFFAPRALSLALFPAMAHAHGAGDTDAVRRHADITTRGLLCVLAPVFVGAIFVSREVMTLFAPKDYADGAGILQVLLAATFFMVIQTGCVNALSSGSAREVRIPVSASIAGCAAGLIAVVPLGLAFGAIGIGLAYLTAALVSAGVPIGAVWRKFDLAWTGVVARAVASVLGALVVAALLDQVELGGSAQWLLDLGAALLVTALSALLLRRDIKEVVAVARRGSARSEAAAPVENPDSVDLAVEAAAEGEPGRSAEMGRSGDQTAIGRVS